MPRAVKNVEALAAFLEGLRGTHVEVRHAERGIRRRLQELADRNAALALAHDRLQQERSRERRLVGLESLQDVLGLDRLPMRIEGYDISNLGASGVVAAMAVFAGGAARKSDYRKFALEGFSQPDDVGALREALTRRFRRQSDAAALERYDPSFEAVPDLILVDGGRGQLNAALGALQEAGLEDVVAVVS
ncbi:MAG: excinuclease ABC subunit UvrC, partial [Thermoleophilia bacterium]|nr:excinuclease ABC subunit UvrC [Thermoleophilia bacterium]